MGEATVSATGLSDVKGLAVSARVGAGDSGRGCSMAGKARGGSSAIPPPSRSVYCQEGTASGEWGSIPVYGAHRTQSGWMYQGIMDGSGRSKVN